jgi:hypothetical protein
VTFTLLGVLRDRALPRHRHVASSVRIGFATLLILLAGPLSGRLFEQLNEGRPQSAVYPVTRALSRALLTRVGQDPGVEITFMGKSAVTNAIVIHIACDHDIAPSYGDELRSLVRQVTKDPEIEVLIFAFDGKWFSHDNAPLKNIAAAS